jgi:hypothetical protein
VKATLVERTGTRATVQLTPCWLARLSEARELVCELEAGALDELRRDLAAEAQGACARGRARAGQRAQIIGAHRAAGSERGSSLNDNFTYLQGQITTADLGARIPSAFHASLTVATSSGSGATAFDQVDFDLGAEYNRVTTVAPLRSRSRGALRRAGGEGWFGLLPRCNLLTRPYCRVPPRAG